VQVRKTSDTTVAPDRGFQVGGLLLRDATGSAENHVLLGLGTGGNRNLKVIVQNTVRGQSAVHPTKVDASDYWLRIERQGIKFSLSARQPNETNWTLLKIIERNDLPETLQVGLAAFASFPGDGPRMRPDLRVRFRQTVIQP
jgi:hypothetical protein